MVKLFVGNCADSASDDDLRRLFERYGKVNEAKVMTGRGFGFVHMDSETDAKTAVQALHKSEFKTRTIQVEFSTGGDRRKDGGGKGGGRGGGRSGGPIRERFDDRRRGPPLGRGDRMPRRMEDGYYGSRGEPFPGPLDRNPYARDRDRYEPPMYTRERLPPQHDYLSPQDYAHSVREYAPAATEYDDSGYGGHYEQVDRYGGAPPMNNRFDPYRGGGGRHSDYDSGWGSGRGAGSYDRRSPPMGRRGYAGAPAYDMPYGRR